MTNTEQRLELGKIWCKNHNFPYKVVGNTLYWQTAIQTAESNEEHETLVWHDWNYFLNIKEEKTNA